MPFLSFNLIEEGFSLKIWDISNSYKKCKKQAVLLEIHGLKYRILVKAWSMPSKNRLL